MGICLEPGKGLCKKSCYTYSPGYDCCMAPGVPGGTTHLLKALVAMHVSCCGKIEKC